MNVAIKPMHPRYRPLEERFWEKVQKTDTCWLWTACRHTSKLPYGVIGVGREIKLAHRVSYELAYGSIPQGMNVLHRCDNASCVRPDHLFLGTQADNAQDMATKGRVRGGMHDVDQHGEKNKQAKLTDDKVRTIRERYAAGGISMEKLASEYGISIGHVSVIISRKAWRHVA